MVAANCLFADYEVVDYVGYLCFVHATCRDYLSSILTGQEGHSNSRIGEQVGQSNSMLGGQVR